jgi:ProP effector
MNARNGAGLAAAETAIEARKIAGKCESFSQTTSPPSSSWRAAAIKALEPIREQFPLAFAKADARFRAPLKIGIHVDVFAAMPELTREDVSRALKFYVTRYCYLKSCTEGRARVGLDGSPAGTVSLAEAENAAKWLARRQKRKKPSAPQPTPQPQQLSLNDLKAAAERRKRTAGAVSR